MTKNVIISILFSVMLLIGIMVCIICNIAISGKLTWSLIPISSIIFSWVISFPSIILGKKGVAVSLISLSIFIVPYLYLLSSLINTKAVFTIGAVMAVIAIAFIWLVFAVFSRIGKARKLVALGITFLSAIPFVFIINMVLSKMITGQEHIVDVWDMLSILMLLILASISFACDYVKKKSR